ncbi:MAG: type II toxin-antitoxin system HicA family toxin [Fimbriimonadaceae bacterium]|nr:type II toxin-antitoxin system HicA family toxin [Fimbriimonadaceae bacterium]
MKRADLVRHLERHGCTKHREGSRHTIYVDGSRTRSTAVPRHREIDEHLVARICRDIAVPPP